MHHPPPPILSQTSTIAKPLCLFPILFSLWSAPGALPSSNSCPSAQVIFFCPRVSFDHQTKNSPSPTATLTRSWPSICAFALVCQIWVGCQTHPCLATTSSCHCQRRIPFSTSHASVLCLPEFTFFLSLGGICQFRALQSTRLGLCPRMATILT